MEYHFRTIEKKWQERWAAAKTFKAEDNSAKPKYYVLDMFPYPSGAGLHVGHPLGYIASDIIARYKRHKGFNVLHPMGYDSFGLPAEQYAIQTGQHPAITTEENINRYREQLDKIGFSFDWDREVRTSNPEYYKWTQWIFIQLFNSWFNENTNKAEKIETLIHEFETNGNQKVNAACDEKFISFSANQWKNFGEKEKSDILMQYRLAYLGEAVVNWCPALGTVLANDEVKDGVSERGGHPVERKMMKQWSMRITAYAQRLLDGLEQIDWSESLKESQRNWIGKSEGTSLKFSLIPNPSPMEKGNKPKWQTADKSVYQALKQFAKENRQPQTESEDKLWQAIRNNQLGVKFRRQHPIETFIADFICLEKSLIIEVDGEIHELTKERDANRTRILNSIGFEVIRFTNKEINNNLDEVIERIRTKISSTPSTLERGQGGEASNTIEVFTTRPDTIFGVAFVTLAPEHDLVNTVTTAEQKNAVEEYVTYAKNRSERERQAEINKVSGVFTGTYVEHPFTKKPIPVWVGDYVLAGYGTGAVMAVPAHDERDFRFATHFKIEKPQVIIPTKEHNFEENSWDEKEGKLINSDFLNGLEVKAAIKKAIQEIEKLNIGTGKINYRLRDAVFGRQRYWGEPIPIYYKNDIPYALSDEELPLVLPEVDKFLPTEDGEPPLARAKNWKYKGEFNYEHTTMPGWAGSSWYFLRYMDAQNKNAFADKKLMDYWQNIDLYIGGSEHATGHLLYVRFWTKFLFDRGLIPVDEPAKKLINQGMIQGTSAIIHRVLNENRIVSAGLKKNYNCTDVHIDVNIVEGNSVDLNALKNWRDDFKNIEFELEDGKLICSNAIEKMSKRWYNVVTPDLICEKYGADTLRLYEMFLGPLEQSKPWNTNGITGVSGFLKKLWKLFYKEDKLVISEEEPNKAELKTLHKTIKKITEDIERFSFNTSVSNFMICVNELTDLKCTKRKILEPLLVLISPYAPHITEELWEAIGHKESIAFAAFPELKAEYLVEDSFNYPVSFNGKTRFNVALPANLNPAEIEKEILSLEETQKYLNGAKPKKVIVVPKKIVNLVV
ncbi:MAG: leucine--tRNA ligase [Sphingobacteriaceae bacterium]|nr:leucine--tRNA ligase [Sphingobacteriaceae bacterium]